MIVHIKSRGQVLSEYIPNGKEMGFSKQKICSRVLSSVTELHPSDFDFVLPADLIAQVPSEKRDASRLFLLSGDGYFHHAFSEFPDLLERHVGKKALLVFNDTQVIPARLFGHKLQWDARTETTGLLGKVELLLCDPICSLGPSGEGWEETWRCLAKPGKSLHKGTRILLAGEHPPEVEILSSEGDGMFQVVFRGTEEGGMLSVLHRMGQVPLPPYIKRSKDVPSFARDKERYQTVYARHPGAVAAPTAGLHFTKEILASLEERGFLSEFVTLHVGPGTFAPIKSELLSSHVMHKERFQIPQKTAAAISQAKKEGRKVLAVGTTVVRALESATPLGMQVPMAGSFDTDIFIYPPYEFRTVDALLTNFHLPKSTLMMLVSAFCGRNRTLSAYQEAVEKQYRFFSYGDAMLIPSPMKEEGVLP